MIKKIVGLYSQKLQSSVLVIVLVVIGVAATVLLFLSFRISNQIEEQTLNKASKDAENIAKTGVERIVQNVTSYGIDNMVMEQIEDGTTYAEFSLIDLDICTDDLEESKDLGIPYCNPESKIVVYPSYIIADYKLNNDETLQVDLRQSSGGGHPPAGPVPADRKIALIVPKDKNASLVVTGFKDDVSGTSIIGKCIVKLSDSSVPSVTSASLDCANINIGAVGTDLLNQVSHNRYIVSIDANSANLFRIKALFPDNSKDNMYISVSGLDGIQLIDLDTIQEYYIRAAVYTASSDKTAYYQYNTVVMAHPMVPEVFDWVLFNASDKPIDK